MIKVLFYSYLSNFYSCRKIAKALNENIHFMFISGNSTPDFRTINDFRGKKLKNTIQQLFTEIVRLLVDLGYVSLEVQYIDGLRLNLMPIAILLSGLLSSKNIKVNLKTRSQIY